MKNVPKNSSPNCLMMNMSSFLIRNTFFTFSLVHLHTFCPAAHSQSAGPMQPVEVALPQNTQAVDIVVIGKVGDQQVQMARQFALLDAHLPVAVLVAGLIVVLPSQPDMVVLHIFYQMGFAHILLRPGLAPGECELAVALLYVVCQPSLQAVGTADLVPYDIVRLRCQGVFNVYSLLSHTQSV